MKKIFLISAALLCNVHIVFSQTIPAYPSADDAVLKAKNSNLLNGLLNQYYNVDVAKCTFSKKYFSPADNKVVDSYFGRYTSNRCSELFPISMPYDRCLTRITVTTPKDASGVIYDVPVEVIYSRLKNDALTNQWEFNSVELGSPKITGGIANNSKAKIALLVEGIKRFPLKDGNLDGSPNEMGYSSADGLKNFSRIDSIYTTGDNIINANEQTWYFEIKGQDYSSNTGDIIESGRITDKYIVEAELKVKLENAKWNIVSLFIRDRYKTEKTKEIYKGPILATFGKTTFDNLYKRNSYYEFDATTKEALNLKAIQLTNSIQNLTFNQETDLKLLVQFFDPENNPEKMALSLFNLFKEIKDKQCILKDMEIYSSYYGKPNSGSTENKIVFNPTIKRGNCLSNPELKEQYKAAGMSSKLMKQTGGDYNAQLKNTDIKLIIKGNNIYLNSIPELTEPIPF